MIFSSAFSDLKPPAATCFVIFFPPTSSSFLCELWLNGSLTCCVVDLFFFQLCVTSDDTHRLKCGMMEKEQNTKFKCKSDRTKQKELLSSPCCD